MAIKVDSNIVSAINKLVDSQGITLTGLAERLGVSSSTLTKWRRVGCGITEGKWAKLFALIRDYLPEERIYIDDAGKPQYSSTVQRVSSYFFEPKFVPQTVPLFELRQLTELNLKIETATQFGTRTGLDMVEYRPRHALMTDVIAVIIRDDDLAPVLPNGTMLFVCTGQVPKNGGIVICWRQGAKKPLVGRYARNSGRVTVSSLLDFKGEDKPLVQAAEADVDEAFAWIMTVLNYEVIVFK
jgi:transcriptional regulator with XRE-family HTH domain